LVNIIDQKKFIKNGLLKDKIRHIVKGISVLSYDVLKFCNLLVKNHLTIPKLDQSFFYRVSSLLTSLENKKENKKISLAYPKINALKEIYDTINPEPPLSREYICEIISYMSKDIEVICRNHITVNFYGRLMKFARCLVESKDTIQIKNTQKDKLARQLVSYLVKDQTLNIEIDLNKEDKDFLTDEIETIKQKFFQNFDPQIETKWYQYLPLMYHILQSVEDHHLKHLKLP